MRKLQIDSEFQNSIPPLTEEEYKQLEENILAEGCRDALIVWEGVIIDGHNRYKVCQEHGIEFEVREKEFKSRDEAQDYIDRNQLGRRNLNPKQMSLIRGRIYNRRKRKQGGDRKSSPQNEGLKCAAKTMAKEFGVGRSTIERDGQFAAAVDKLNDVIPGVEEKVLIGKGAPKKVIVEAAKIIESDTGAAKKMIDNSKQKLGATAWERSSSVFAEATRVADQLGLPISNERVHELVSEATGFKKNSIGKYIQHHNAVKEFPDLKNLALHKATGIAAERRLLAKEEAILGKVGNGGFSKEEEDDAKSVESVYLQVDKLYSDITQGSDAVGNWYTWWSKYRDIRRVEGFVLRLRQLADEVESIISKKGDENGSEAAI